jgi:DMSO/TMAO reductase YedYZ molybdopterin-dependent catalytic subunit
MDDRSRTGPERVPPGQYVTQKWPVLTYGETPKIAAGDWSMRVFGLVAAELRLDWAAFQALPRFEVTADFHCVTRFSTLDNRWAGVATRELLRRVEVDAEAAHVVVHCHGGYTTNLPLEDFLSERALLADRHGGRPLAVEHGGPLRLVVPHLYAWKSCKWIRGLIFMDEDRPGYWERHGYHMRGDPFREERFG